MDLSSRAVDFDLGRSVGPMYWGLVTSVFACGISVVQANFYFHQNKDNALLRWTAATIFIFELASTSLILVAVFQYFVPHFGDVANIWAISPSLAAECIFAIQITFIAQLFFAYQIYRVKPVGFGGKILMGFLLAFTTLSWLFGAVCFTMMFIHQDWEHWILGIEIGFTGSKGFAALFDIISTITMCVYLKEPDTAVRVGTRRLIRTLRILFLNRGALVTIAQVMLVVVNWAFHGELYWITPHLLVTRLYVNTFFAMLNSRQYLAEKHGTDRSEIVFDNGIGSLKTSTLPSGRTRASTGTDMENDSSAELEFVIEKTGPSFAALQV